MHPLAQQILSERDQLNKIIQDASFGDHLFNLVIMDYIAALPQLRGRFDDDSKQQLKLLSLMSQDAVRLRRSDQQAAKLKIQKDQHEAQNDKTEEQILAKFIEWTERPAVRKALILAPMERDRRLRKLWNMPPTEEDPLVEKETKGDPAFNEPEEPPIKPNQAKTGESGFDSDPKRPGGSENPYRQDGSLEHDPEPPLAEIDPEDEARLKEDYSEQENMAEPDGVRENYSNQSHAPSHCERAPKPNSTLPRPNPLDAFSEPVHYASSRLSSIPLHAPIPSIPIRETPLRPAHGFNSLG